MSIITGRTNSSTATTAPPTSRNTEVNSASGGAQSFTVVLSTQSNGTPYTDAEVKRFFAGNPSHFTVAEKAAALGMNRDQIVAAMRLAGYGGQSISEVKNNVDTFVADAANGYAWGTNGKLVATKDTASGLPAGPDLSKYSVEEVTNQVNAWVAQGLEMAEIARRAEAGGVSEDTMNSFSAMHGGVGRLAIDNAYSNYSLQQSMVGGIAQDSGRFVRLGEPKGGNLTDAQQLWNAQHSGMYTDNAAVGGNYSWTDLGGWQRPKAV